MKPLLVRDLMTVGVPTCKPDSPVGDIARFLLEHEVEAMCVLDEEGQAIGVVGREELVRVYGRENARCADGRGRHERKESRNFGGNCP